MGGQKKSAAAGEMGEKNIKNQKVHHTKFLGKKMYVPPILAKVHSCPVYHSIAVAPLVEEIRQSPSQPHDSPHRMDLSYEKESGKKK